MKRYDAVTVEWDGTEFKVQVLEGPVPELDMSSNDVRILYEDGTCHEITKAYAEEILNPLH